MGVNFGKYATKKSSHIFYFRRKRIVVDYFNLIFRYLATVRKGDGDYYRNDKGECISHILGLTKKFKFYLENEIFPIFVVDGSEKDAKSETMRLRSERKTKMCDKMMKYLEEGEKEKAISVRKQIIEFDKDIYISSVQLAQYYGFPVIFARGEGESQACEIAKKYNCVGIESTDKDIILFGGNRLISRLDAGAIEYYDTKTIYENHSLDKEKIIDMAILIGTDYNPGGLYNYGPVKSYNYVMNASDGDINKLYPNASYLRDLFHNPVLISDKELDRQITNISPQLGKLSQFLRRNSFSRKQTDEIIRKHTALFDISIFNENL